MKWTKFRYLLLGVFFAILTVWGIWNYNAYEEDYQIYQIALDDTAIIINQFHPEEAVSLLNIIKSNNFNRLNKGGKYIVLKIKDQRYLLEIADHYSKAYKIKANGIDSVELDPYIEGQ